MKKFRISFFFIRMHLLFSQMENNYKFTVCVGLFSLKMLCHYLYLNVRKTLSGEKKNSLRLPNLVDIIIRKKNTEILFLLNHKYKFITPHFQHLEVPEQCLWCVEKQTFNSFTVTKLARSLSFYWTQGLSMEAIKNTIKVSLVTYFWRQIPLTLNVIFKNCMVFLLFQSIKQK